MQHEDVCATVPVCDLTLNIQFTIDELYDAICELFGFDPVISSDKLKALIPVGDLLDNDERLLSVDARKEVYWPLEYVNHAGTITEFDVENEVSVNYDGDDVESGLGIYAKKCRILSISLRSVRFSKKLASNDQNVFSEKA